MMERVDWFAFGLGSIDHIGRFAARDGWDALCELGLGAIFIGVESRGSCNLTEYGYDMLYRTWGSSIVRRLDVQLRGYEHCARSDNRILRRHKALFFKRQCGLLLAML